MKNEKRLSHRYKPLCDEQVSRIHEGTMEIFEEVGFEVHEPEALSLFRQVASDYDAERGVVRLKESTVKDLLSSVPSELVLCGREEKHDAHLGVGKVHFGTGGTALNILDYDTNNRRPALLEDLVDVVRLTDQLEHIDIVLLPTYPNDLAIEEVDVNRFYTGLAYSSKHIMGGVYTSKGIDDVIKMAEKVAGSPEALRERPFISLITCGISPLRLDSKYGAYMLQVARSGIPVVVPAEPLCGATSPMSLAGTLVIQNCDALIHVMLTQLARRGAPVVYGCVSSSTDLRDLGYLGGSVESALINAGTAQMTQYYGIPYYGTAGISDSKTLDAQAGYESAVTNMLVALAGADFIHDAAGLMEFALTVSKEKLVIDNEILGIVGRAVRGIEVNDDTLALDVIKNIGPGGSFIHSRHTRKHMRKEHYWPRLSDRDRRKVWEADGKQTTAQRAHEIVQRMLSEAPKYHLPKELMQSIIEDFPAVAKYNEEGVLKA